MIKKLHMQYWISRLVFKILVMKNDVRIIGDSFKMFRKHSCVLINFEEIHAFQTTFLRNFRKRKKALNFLMIRKLRKYKWFFKDLRKNSKVKLDNYSVKKKPLISLSILQIFRKAKSYLTQIIKLKLELEIVSFKVYIYSLN